jgi:hypothetical protein
MSTEIDVGSGQGVVAVEMAHLPEIETMRVMGPAENIKDARAVVITVAKAMGGQIHSRPASGCVSVAQQVDEADSAGLRRSSGAFGAGSL